MNAPTISFKLPFSFKHSVLGVGSETNTTFSLLKKDTVFISRPYKDLKMPQDLNEFMKDVAREKKRLGVSPDIIACDLHPEYMSVKYAREMAAADVVGVQHHHAHVAACMAEHGLRKKVIGVVFDGTGYGADGASWGGEFLVSDYYNFKRAAHIAYVAMPGGDKAVLEPARMAFSYIYKAYGGINTRGTGVLERIGRNKKDIFKNMIEKKINSPLTSSAGRLFDAVASLVGQKDVISYQGEAALMLEDMARGSDCKGFYGFNISKKDGMISVGFESMIREIVSDFVRRKAPADIARKFHDTLARAIKKICGMLRREYALNEVALTGGVFQNRILLDMTKEYLSMDKFSIYAHTVVPANDRNVSLGQVIVAACRMEKNRCV